MSVHTRNATALGNTCVASLRKAHMYEWALWKAPLRKPLPRLERILPGMAMTRPPGITGTRQAGVARQLTRVNSNPPRLAKARISAKHSVFFTDHQNKESEDEQARLANLGAMLDHLREHVPLLLQNLLPKELILEDVLLRVCPSHFEQINSYLPNIRGHVSYYATCKAAQLFLTSLVLNPKAHLHIELIRTSKFPDPSCCLVHSTKIYVRWSTCSEGCHHLQEPSSSNSLNSSTSNATLGSHKWSRIDADELHRDWSITNSISDLGKGIIGLKKHDTQLERTILGVFIFELSGENDRIAVHTVEDMNIIERHEERDVGNKLRVC